MPRQCANCGAIYDYENADYCNACGSEDLRTVVDAPAPAAPKRPMRDDGLSLTVATLLWVSGVLYMAGVRQPRTWESLFLFWAAFSVAGLLAGLMLRNIRTFLFFSAFGALFLSLYGLLKLS